MADRSLPTENTRPNLSSYDVQCVLAEQFGIAADQIDNVKKLVSYDDQNFYVQLKPTGKELLLKITNWKDSQNTQLITEHTNLMAEVGKTIPCSVPKRTVNGGLLGRYFYDQVGQRRECIVRLFDFLPGTTIKGCLSKSQAFQWGSLLGRLHVIFEQMDFPTIRARSFLWSWDNVGKSRDYLDVHKDPDDKAIIEDVFHRYEKLLNKLKLMKRDILHGDLNERNVLVNSQDEVYAVLDFGDSQGGPLIWDVAVLLMYMSLVVEDTENNLVQFYGHALAGYCQHMPQIIRNFGDVETLRTLVCARFTQSLTLGLHSYELSHDPYVLTSQQKGWPSLRKIYSEPADRIAEVWQTILAPLGITVR